jgi:hypothetical protein
VGVDREFHFVGAAARRADDGMTMFVFDDVPVRTLVTATNQLFHIFSLFLIRSATALEQGEQ